MRLSFPVPSIVLSVACIPAGGLPDVLEEMRAADAILARGGLVLEGEFRECFLDPFSKSSRVVPGLSTRWQMEWIRSDGTDQHGALWLHDPVHPEWSYPRSGSLSGSDLGSMHCWFVPRLRAERRTPDSEFARFEEGTVRTWTERGQTMSESEPLGMLTTIARTASSNSPWSAILLATGRGYTRWLTRVESLESEGTQVRIRAEGRFDRAGRWELSVDPGSAFLVRSARFFPDREDGEASKRPSFSIETEGHWLALPDLRLAESGRLTQSEESHPLWSCRFSALREEDGPSSYARVEEKIAAARADSSVRWLDQPAGLRSTIVRR